MTLYTASFETVVLRFVLMMGVIIGSFTSGFPIVGILALPIFLSAMMAVSFKRAPKKAIAKMSIKKSNNPKNEKQAA